jgi:hypothetical protein
MSPLPMPIAEGRRVSAAALGLTEVRLAARNAGKETDVEGRQPNWTARRPRPRRCADGTVFTIAGSARRSRRPCGV